MPLKRNLVRPEGSAPAAQPANDVGTLRKLLAGGTRMVSGVVGAGGLWPGAVAGGLGELIAEGLEGSLDWDTTPTRVGVEAGLGAVPFSKVAKLGKAGASMVRGGAFSGAGDVGRQWAEGNFDEQFEPGPDGKGWNYGRTAIATGLGTVTGGVLGHMAYGPKAPKDPIPLTRVGERTMRAPMSAADKARPQLATTLEEELTNVVEALPRRKNPYADDLSDVRTALGHERTARASRAASNAKQETADKAGFLADLERQISGNIDELPNKNAKFAEDASKMVDDAASGSDKLAKSWVAEDESKLDSLFKSAMERADARQIETVKKTLERQSPTITETVKAPGQTLTTRFKAPSPDDEGLDELETLLSGAVRTPPDPVKVVEDAVRRAPGRVQRLLQNLDEKGLKEYAHWVDVEGESPLSAYRMAWRSTVQRKAEISRTIPSKPVEPTAPKPPQAEAPPNPVAALDDLLKPTPNTIDADDLRQTTHPSFYDEGFEGLENATDAVQRRATTNPSFYDEGFEGLEDAAPKVVPPKGGPPPAAAAKLAADIEAATASGQKDIAEQLPNLSRIFNDPTSSPAARKEAGKQLRELSKLLRSPKAEGAPAAAPDWVAEQSAAVDKLSKSKKGTTLGAGLGGAQDIFEIARQNPEFATSAVTTILGGAIGGAMDDEGTSLDGILGGAALGAGVGLAPRLAQAIGRDAADLADAGKVRQMAVEIASKLPQVQRASLLTSTNLPANAILGPWGSVMVKLIEDVLKGNHQQALPALKEAWNIAEFGKNMYRLRGQARDRLIHGELGRDAIDDRLVQQGGNLSSFDEALIFPGWAMTAGDEAAYSLLSKYGYGEDEIRKAVLTSEPTSHLGRQIANFGKGSGIGNLLLPFKRTPANIMEQGAQRLPFVGPAISKRMGRDVSGREALVEQGLSLGAGVGAGAIAANIDDDANRRAARAYVTNPLGVYSMAGNLGWLVGDAIAANKNPDSVLTDPFTYEQLTPLPTTEPIQQFGKVARNVISGNVNKPTDVIPRSLSFEPLRKMFATSAEALGAEEVGQMAYTPPRQRGLRRVRGPRKPQ